MNPDSSSVHIAVHLAATPSGRERSGIFDEIRSNRVVQAHIERPSFKLEGRSSFLNRF